MKAMSKQLGVTATPQRLESSVILLVNLIKSFLSNEEFICLYNNSILSRVKYSRTSRFEKVRLPLMRNQLWAKQFLNVHIQCNWDTKDFESSLSPFPGNNNTAPIERNPSDSSISRKRIQPVIDKLACLTIEYPKPEIFLPL
jgi:hypothetical protein